MKFKKLAVLNELKQWQKFNKNRISRSSYAELTILKISIQNLSDFGNCELDRNQKIILREKIIKVGDVNKNKTIKIQVTSKTYDEIDVLATKKCINITI